MIVELFGCLQQIEAAVTVAKSDGRGSRTKERQRGGAVETTSGAGRIRER
jgi:hypothetical protein